MLTPEIVMLCNKVFFARIIDVSMATCRTVVTVRGKTLLATCIGFFEVFIWFLVIREALNIGEVTGMQSLIIAVAYSGGYATGTFVGSLISKSLITTQIQVQVVSSKKDKKMIKTLQDTGYELTLLSTEETQFSGEKYIIISTITNKQLKAFKSLVYHLDPKAFISVQEAKDIYYAPASKTISGGSK